MDHSRLRFAELSKTGNFEIFRSRSSYARTLPFSGQLGYSSRAFTTRPFEDEVLDKISAMMASYPIIGDTVLYFAETRPLILAKDCPEIKNGRIILNPSVWNDQASIPLEGYDGLVRRSEDGSARVLDTRNVNPVLRSDQDIESNPLVYLLTGGYPGFDNLERMIKHVKNKKIDLIMPRDNGFYVPGIQGRDVTGLRIYCDIKPDESKDNPAFSIARWIPKEGEDGFIGPLSPGASGYYLESALKSNRQ